MLQVSQLAQQALHLSLPSAKEQRARSLSFLRGVACVAILYRACRLTSERHKSSLLCLVSLHEQCMSVEGSSLCGSQYVGQVWSFETESIVGDVEAETGLLRMHLTS